MEDPRTNVAHCIGPFPPQTSGPSQRPSSAPPGPYLGSLICSLVSLQPPLYSLFTEPVSLVCERTSEWESGVLAPWAAATICSSAQKTLASPAPGSACGCCVAWWNSEN